MTDPVFPLPEPTFLWVHDLQWQDHNATQTTVDPEGRWQYTATVTHSFVGYITAPNPREIDRAAARNIVLDAVALAPRDLAITDECTLIAPAEVGYLAGTYRVSVVRPNPSHLRLLCTRYTADETPERSPGTTATVTPVTIQGALQ